MKKLIICFFICITLTTYSCKKNCNQTDNCNLDPESGPCKAYIPRYYYDKNEKKCKEFIWGGCGGIVPFETLEECERHCDCK